MRFSQFVKYCRYWYRCHRRCWWSGKLHLCRDWVGALFFFFFYSARVPKKWISIRRGGREVCEGSWFFPSRQMAKSYNDLREPVTALTLSCKTAWAFQPSVSQEWGGRSSILLLWACVCNRSESSPNVYWQGKRVPAVALRSNESDRFKGGWRCQGLGQGHPLSPLLWLYAAHRGEDESKKKK